MAKQSFIYRRKEPSLQKEVTLFRKEFRLSAGQLCRKTEIGITADTRYILYLNGRYVCRGPESGDAWRKYYDTPDISSWLREGVNCIAVKMIHFPVGDEGIQQFELGPTGLVRSPYGGLCIFGISGTEIPGTDAGWKWMTDASYGFRPSVRARQAGDMEYIQAALAEQGWTEAGYDDSGWQDAVVVQETEDCARGSVYGVLYNWILCPRDIPMPEEKEISARAVQDKGTVKFVNLLTGEPVVIPPFTEAVCEIDMGRLVTAYVRSEFEEGGMGQGEYLYSECYYQEKEGSLVKVRRDDWKCGVLEGERDEISLGKEAFVYEPFEYRAFRYLRLSLRTEAERMVLKGIRFRETGYPFPARACFEPERDILRKIWETSLHTLRCCMQDTYIDCPYYERLQYGMDAMIEALHTYPVLGDDRLARKAFLDLAGTQMPDGMIHCNAPANDRHVIPAFGIYYIDMLYQHYQYFGDKKLIERYWAVCAGILGFFERNLDRESGVVSGCGYWEFVDWTEEWNEFQGVPCDRRAKEGQYLYTLLYAYGVLRMAQLTEAVYGSGAARHWRERHREIRELVNRKVWNPEKGYYRTSEQAERYSEHAQVWAVLGECVSGEEAKNLLDRMIAEPALVRCSYSMKHYYNRALDMAGIDGGKDRMWREYAALLESGSTTWPEDPVTARSDCHGWSTIPIYEICHGILGIRPGAPGFASVLIAPGQWELGNARGKIWTQEGCISVERYVETRDGISRAGVSFEFEKETEVTVRIAGRDILSGRYRRGECSTVL